MGDNNYIAILIESLQKKIKVLDDILDKNEEQRAVIEAEVLDYEAFDRIIDEKSKMITELRFLDTGFETIYDRVKEALNRDKAMYKEEIRQLQDLIRTVTEKSASVQTGEQRNDIALKNRLRGERQKIRQSKATVQAVTGYYKNMAGNAVPTSNFMDQKK